MYRNIKRILDILFSAILLVLGAIPLLIVALIIKIDSPGEALFKQERLGLNGKTFKIYKFRSMCVGAEKKGSGVYSGKNDARVTRVGKIIRATSIDELPQLIDILIGNMSLVGPRPERVEHVEKYTEDLAEFEYRLKVRGGLTGYAQIYGKYNTSPYDKLQLDLIYIQNYSIFLDIKLILMTIKIMFMKESTEGFTEEQRKDIQEKE